MLVPGNKLKNKRGKIFLLIELSIFFLSTFKNACLQIKKYISKYLLQGRKGKYQGLLCARHRVGAFWLSSHGNSAKLHAENCPQRLQGTGNLSRHRHGFPAYGHTGFVKTKLMSAVADRGWGRFKLLRAVTCVRQDATFYFRHF